VSTAVSFVLLVLVVAGSFTYISGNPIKEAWLGFNGSDVTPPIAQQIGLESQRGFLVFTVEPDSPAAVAGFHGGDRSVVVDGKRVVLGGDIIIAIGGVPVTGGRDIIDILRAKEIGDTVKFTILRGNTSHDLNLVIGEKDR
jgi:S1-C subfamily serine protease